MNDTYINYIDQLLDLAERNDTFCLTSRAFNEFATEVRETLEKQDPMKPLIDERDSYLDAEPYDFIVCPRCGVDLIPEALEWEDIDDKEKIRKYCEVVEPTNYCYNCGQKLDWTED